MSVPPSLRRDVLRRDGHCVLYDRDRHHVCRDAWGRSHGPYAVERLSLEHVKQHLAMGKRAPDSPAHLVAICYGANLRPPSKDERAFLRDYLAALYPEVWAAEPVAGR